MSLRSKALIFIPIFALFCFAAISPQRARAEDCAYYGVSGFEYCTVDDSGNTCYNQCERSCEPDGTPRGWECRSYYPYPYPTPYDYPTPYSYPTPVVYYSLTVGTSGSGTVTGSGISCPGTCSTSQTSGTWETLIATPSGGYSFSSWSGACAGQGSTCSIQMNTNYSATATFVPPFNYSLSNSGSSNATKTSGNAYTQNTITETIIAGNTQAVTLVPSGLPSGTSYSIAPSSCNPSCSSTITFTVSASTAAGTYPITVTGSPLSKTTTFNLVVSPNPSTLTCAADPSTALVGHAVTWTGTINGGTPPYTYSWSGTNIPTSPAPSTNPYTTTYTTIGNKSAVLTITDSDNVQSSCAPGTVQVIFNPNFNEF